MKRKIGGNLLLLVLASTQRTWELLKAILKNCK